MALISKCINADMAGMTGCLVNPGAGAAPGGSWGNTAAASCSNYDRKGMVECLTGVGEACCFVLGISGCVILINGEPVTIF
jgi:hypothetical protein